MKNSKLLTIIEMMIYKLLPENLAKKQFLQYQNQKDNIKNIYALYHFWRKKFEAKFGLSPEDFLNQENLLAEYQSYIQGKEDLSFIYPEEMMKANNIELVSIEAKERNEELNDEDYECKNIIKIPLQSENFTNDVNLMKKVIIHFFRIDFSELNESETIDLYLLSIYIHSKSSFASLKIYQDACAYYDIDLRYFVELLEKYTNQLTINSKEDFVAKVKCKLNG